LIRRADCSQGHNSADEGTRGVSHAAGSNSGIDFWELGALEGPDPTCGCHIPVLLINTTTDSSF